MNNTPDSAASHHRRTSHVGNPIVIDDLLQRVRREYVEMPELRLTFAQATRFWCLDHPTCARLLDALVNARFLVRTSDGLYARAGSSLSPRKLPFSESDHS